MAAILLYHAVADVVRDDLLEVRPSTLRRHLAWCRDLGFATASLGEAIAHTADRLVAVTFDDGLASCAAALREFQSIGVQPTLFVCPGKVGRENDWASAGRVRERLLDVDELRSLRDSGVVIGCHSWDHQPYAGRSREAIEQDLALCREWFGTALDQPAEVFAWPFGHHDEVARTAVSREFRYALALDPPWDAEPSALALPRLLATDTLSFQEFADALELASFILDERVAPLPPLDGANPVGFNGGRL
jgi:peptidoglycan/xylan/chitin deacetylase (PgdA/CDA1 family)